MVKSNLKRVLEISFTDDKGDRHVEVEVELTYYRTTYGDDADGNRYVPCLDLDNYSINISNACINDVLLTEDEKSEVYQEAFSEVMRNWEAWAEGE